MDMKKNEQQLSLRIDAELLKKFAKVSKFENRSMNAQLLVMIKDKVDQFEKEYGEA